MKKAATLSIIQCRIANIKSTLWNFMVVYARCFTRNILQINSKGHWEAKIISMAAEGK